MKANCERNEQFDEMKLILMERGDEWESWVCFLFLCLLSIDISPFFESEKLRQMLCLMPDDVNFRQNGNHSTIKKNFVGTDVRSNA